MSDRLAAFTLCDPDFDQVLQSAAEAGFRHLALYFGGDRLPWSLESLSDDDARVAKDRLAAHGLSPIAAGAGANVLTDDGTALMMRMLEGAAKLGVSAFDTGSLATKGKDATTIEQETATFCRNMSRIGDAAAERGLTICLETHGGLTGTVPACLDLMRRLDHDHVKVGYDPANILFYEGASPLDQLADLVPYIGHVHAKDQVGGKDVATFPTVGKGDVPYEELIPILLASGYTGYISVERAPGDTPAARAQELCDAYAFLANLLN